MTLCARQAVVMLVEDDAALRLATAAIPQRIAPTLDILGVPRKTLDDKLTRHRIDPAAFRR